LGVVLTTPPGKKFLVTKPHIKEGSSGTVEPRKRRRRRRRRNNSAVT
jgi:hypothetical protein